MIHDDFLMLHEACATVHLYRFAFICWPNTPLLSLTGFGLTDSLRKAHQYQGYPAPFNYKYENRFTCYYYL